MIFSMHDFEQLYKHNKQKVVFWETDRVSNSQSIQQNSNTQCKFPT